jgi:cysteine desulfurase
VSPITENTPQSRDFQNDLPLHPAARDLLGYFFDLGWPDPTKIHQRSAQLRNQIGVARESIAANLGIATSELEVVGELGFGFHVAVAGLLSKDHEFVIGKIDRQVIHAFAREHSNSGGRVRVLEPNANGLLNYQEALTSESAVVSWQAINREVGIKQRAPRINVSQSLFADMTAAFPLNSLPEKWDSALWDPRVFGGPQGIALLGISHHGHWRSPTPEIDQRRVYGSFSKPLLLATAVALENWIKSAAEDLVQIKSLNTSLREILSARIPGIQIASPIDADPRFFAFVIPGVTAEEVTRSVEKSGFLIDAGSACGAGALSPSHVLNAMGFASDGNFRMTIKAHHTDESITDLVEALVKGVAASA